MQQPHLGTDMFQYIATQFFQLLFKPPVKDVNCLAVLVKQETFLIFYDASCVSIEGSLLTVIQKKSDLCIVASMHLVVFTGHHLYDNHILTYRKHAPSFQTHIHNSNPFTLCSTYFTIIFFIASNFYLYFGQY